MRRIYSIYLVLILTVSVLLTACSSTDTPDMPDIPAKFPPVSDKKDSTESVIGIKLEILSFELSDTFKALLDEFNEEHKAITFYEGDYSSYLGKNENPEIDPTAYAGNFKAMPPLSSVVTLEQITADMEL